MDDSKDKKSKYSLKMKTIDVMKMAECDTEVKALAEEFCRLENSCDKVNDTYPLIREMLMGRINQLHNRMCYLNSRIKL